VRKLLIVLAAVAGSALLGPPSASAATTWLCKPGVEPDPCFGSLRTTVATPDGGGSVEEPVIPKRRRIDCFYVYPTVSEDEGTNADLSIDPEQIAIARFQASRFSERCRVFAPMYRQLTLSAISGPPVPRSALDLAYSDVRAAWQEYMRKHNKGRGVILIGHSQGTGMLTSLIREMIDPYKAARRRLVSAMLLGGNVLVKQGASRGGSFTKIPACRRARKTGCVIAYSIYDEAPPADSRFGRPGGTFADLFGLAGRTDLEVLCTNPAALRGGARELTTLLPTDPFPGIIGIGVAATFNGEMPTAPTPWIQPADRYTGECVRSDGANVLMLVPIGSARNLNALPDATWGIHLGDVNLPLGDLVELAGVQTRSWLKTQARRKAKAKRRARR
jgi:hypothetical protein